MKRLLLITLLVLSRGSVYAEWVAVEKTNQPGLQIGYVDPTTIRQDEILATIWQFIDFKWMQGNPKGTSPDFCRRRPISNSTARQNAFGCWRSRSSHTVWKPVYGMLDT